MSAIAKMSSIELFIFTTSFPEPVGLGPAWSGGGGDPSEEGTQRWRHNASAAGSSSNSLTRARKRAASAP